MTARKKAGPGETEVYRHAMKADGVKAGKAPEKTETLSPEAARRMLHELQTHQTQLEMQNDALRRAHADLEAFHARYFDFYNAAPVGFLTVDSKGLILEANLTIATLLGVERESLVRQPLTLFVFPDDREVCRLHIKGLFATDTARACEFRLLKKEGLNFWVRMEAALVHEGETALCRAVLIDITERRQVEETLRRGAEIQTVLKEIAEAGTQSFSLNELYAIVYQSLERVLPARNFYIALLDESSGQIVRPYCVDEMFYVPRKRPLGNGLTEYVMRQGRVMHLNQAALDCLRKSGEVSPLEAPAHDYLGAPLKDSTGKSFGVIAVVSEGKQKSFKPEDADLLSTIAAQVSMVIERKQAEEALRSKTALFEAQANATLDGILVVNENRKRIVNQRIIELFNVPRHIANDADDTLLLEHVVSLTKYPEQFLEKVLYLYDHITETSFDEIEFTNGMVLERYSAPVLGSGREYYGRLWQFRDITERKQAEKALALKEAQLRTLVETIPDLVWLKDADGVFLMCNQVFGRLVDASEADIIGKTDYDFVDKELADFFRKRDLIAKNAGKAIVNEERLTFANDGHGALVETIKTPMIDFDGKFIGILGIARDITERKRVEEALRSSEERYHALMEQSSEALVLVDIQNRQVVEVNRRFTELLGYSLPEDAPLYAQQIVLDSSRNLDRIFDETLRQQRILPTEPRIFMHKNGSHVPVERAATAVNIGERTYVLNSLRDMTEERRRQAEVEADINVAQRVQRELLPKLPETPFVSLRTLYYPSRFVSGDSYYLEWLDEEKLLRGFLIDVSGHGLATALQMASVNVLVREIAVSKLSLLEQIKQLNARVTQYFADGSYAALLGFELDLSAKELRYVAAGITQLYANGKRIITPGTFVGLWENAQFNEAMIPLAQGDTFCFLTDGFTDYLEESKKALVFGKDFESDVTALGKLAESGKLRDDATGICVKIENFCADNQ